MFRALVVVCSPMEVELEDLVVSHELTSSQDALRGSKGRHGVQLLNETNYDETGSCRRLAIQTAVWPLFLNIPLLTRSSSPP